MALKVVRRKSTGAWTISGTINGVRVQKRAQSNNKRRAEEEAAALETAMLREDWHGPRPAAKTIGQAMVSYAEAVDRSPRTYSRLIRIGREVGENTPLAAIDQDLLTRLRGQLLKPDANPATFAREIVGPLRAVLNYAADLGWCDRLRLKAPRQAEGRTRFLMPTEAERLIAAAASHLRPLLIFLPGTGARMSEALELDWRDVDLVGGRAIFWQTKSGRRRVAALPPRAIAELADLPYHEGPVFRTPAGEPYYTSGRQGGGQIKTAWRGAIRRCGLGPDLTPHDLRHTWASWHYALHKDLLRLKQDGGWSSVELVERYSHLLPAGHEDEIRQFLGCDRDVTTSLPRRPVEAISY